MRLWIAWLLQPRVGSATILPHQDCIPASEHSSVLLSAIRADASSGQESLSITGFIASVPLPAIQWYQPCFTLLGHCFQFLGRMSPVADGVDILSSPQPVFHSKENVPQSLIPVPGSSPTCGLLRTDLGVPIMAPLGPWQLLQNICLLEQVLVLDGVWLEYMRPSLATLMPLSSVLQLRSQYR